MILIFIALLGAHICGDVLVYLPFLSRFKRDKSLWSMTAAIGIHSGMHAGWVVLWLLPFNNLGLIVHCAGYVMVAHFAIDCFRILIERVVFNRETIPIIKRKNVLASLKAGEDSPDRFMQKYFKRWVLLNYSDQAIHVLTLALAVAGYAIRHPASLP
jgi:hypothetical protein